MFFVSWIREYPIFEPAEGGYYYAGEQVFYCKEYPTWKKANRAYQKLKREFLDYCGFYMEKDFCPRDSYVFYRDSDVEDFMTGGCGKWRRPHMILHSKYIGREEWIQITRRRPVERGRVPYC